jgi:hypothetical protein
MRNVRPRFASTASSRIAKGASHRAKITVINKLMTGFTPSTREEGSAIGSVIRNNISETTPDGGFSVAWSFKLTDFPNYADYTDVFQWYKILGVKIHFYPLNNTYPALQASGATNPIEANTDDGTTFQNCTQAPSVVFAKDMQSASLFSDESTAMQHNGSGFHMFNDGRELMVYVSPKATGLLGTAGSEAVYEHPLPQWISTNSATVPHYGLRSWWNMTNGSAVRVVMEMKVAFKETKV